MRVLHVLAPAPFGGLEHVVRALARVSISRGHDAQIAALLAAGEADAHPFVAALRADGIPHHVVTAGARGYLAERAAVTALRRRLDAEVIHTHGYRADVVHGAFGRDVARVSTVHGFTGGGWRNRAYEAMQRRALRAFDGVAAVSHPLGDRLVAEGVERERLRVIVNAWDGAGERLDAAAARHRLDVAQDVFHVGWVGRLSHEKGPDVLLDAIARLTDLPLVVTLVGDGAQRAALAARASHGELAGCVRLIGRVDDAAALMAGFDVLALTSRTEGTPMVLFEAMEAGVPIVATSVGGVPDALGGDALLVPLEDAGALAIALRAVHDDPAAARVRADLARRRLAERHGVGRWMDTYESLYADARERAAARERTRIFALPMAVQPPKPRTGGRG
ncbi:MAG TPA: glycosyltransferase [Longimicrobium sp.]|nr:glycosyltransferase [Longimicrobium sp.]